MNRRGSLTNCALAFLAIGMIVALLKDPGSRWIVAEQATMAELPAGSLPWAKEWDVRAPRPPLPGEDQRAIDRMRQVVRSIAAAHPSDCPMQIAATESAEYPNAAPALRALVPRFPRSASLRARILFAMCAGGEVVLRLGDRHLQASQFELRYATPPATPESLAAFDRDAREGERLAPDNAYFPLMRAYGLFAALRDSAALVEIGRAGSLKRLDDYSLDSKEGALGLLGAASLGPNSLQRAAIAERYLFGSNLNLYTAARVAASLAALKQMRGQTKAAMAIRIALMRYGSLMRLQSPTTSGSIQGIEIQDLALSPPQEVIRRIPGFYGMRIEIARQRLFAYTAALRRLGEEPEACWSEAEFAAGEPTRISPPQVWPFSTGVGARRLQALWVLDLLTLSNIICLLALGMVALGARRRPHHGAAAPLVVAVLAGLMLMARHSAWGDNPSLGLYGYTQWYPSVFWDRVLEFASDRSHRVLAASAIPLGAVVVLARLALLRRVSLSEAFSDGFKKFALPAVSILTLVYGALVFSTVRTNEQLLARLASADETAARMRQIRMAARGLLTRPGVVVELTAPHRELRHGQAARSGWQPDRGARLSF